MAGGLQRLLYSLGLEIWKRSLLRAKRASNSFACKNEYWHRRQMFLLHTLAVATPTLARSFRHWIYHLGGLGFIPLGLLDSSVIPLPGSMDLLTIVLSAGNQGLWLYYAMMATVGSVIGGFVTYRLARKGGKETLERKFPARRLEKVYRIFRRWGFWAIAIAALLPPPAPMVPFLFAAGAMQYS